MLSAGPFSRLGQHASISTLPSEITFEKMPQRKKKSRGRPRRTVSTLTPELLTPGDYLDLGGKRRLRLSFPQSPKGSNLQLYYERPRPAGPGSHKLIPFPPHAHGFLYCAPQPNLTPISASIRLRCTPTCEASFAAGYDLTLPNGLPWQTLVSLAGPTIREQLLREGHLTPTHLARFAGRQNADAALILFGPAQLFPVNFAHALTLTIVGPDSLHMLYLANIFRDGASGTPYFAFEGPALAHFVASPPPRALRPSLRVEPPRADALFCATTRGAGVSHTHTHIPVTGVIPYDVGEWLDDASDSKTGPWRMTCASLR
ncbi:hypothetical protein B0H17DRAFT_1208288 [Mycena rosella]|uniref:Uncharacterized protein n=1 Tax=Mycena rosella TaxID=1033263 RepID=A0AAD7D1D8_MYCRO|nr:hypothetical protein B0H17DRAFT_1208288 [Mycena rosella]